MLIFGIDPGLTGAVGVLRDGAFLAVEDMPTVVKGIGSVKYEISPSGLKQSLRKHASVGDSVTAVLERVTPCRVCQPQLCSAWGTASDALVLLLPQQG